MSRVNQFIFVVALFFSAFNVSAQSQYHTEQQLYEIDSIKAEIASAESHDTTKCKYLMNLALYYYYFDLDTTLKLCLQAKDLAEKERFPFGMTQSYGWLGYIYTNTGDLDRALLYNNKSMEISLSAKDYVSVASLLNNNASIFINQGKVEAALECHLGALNIHMMTGNQEEIGRALNSIALIYKLQGYFDKALELYQKSLTIRRLYGNHRDIGEVLNNIGVMYAKQGRNEEAIPYYRESLGHRKIANIPGAIANSLENFGNLYSDIGLHDSALFYSLQALEIREELGLKPALCEVYVDVGIAYYSLGDIAQAEYYSEMGYELALDLGYPRFIVNASINRIQILEEKGNYREAFETHKMLNVMEDSLNNEETQRAAAQQEAKFNYNQQKAKDDALFQQQTAEQESQKKIQAIIAYSAIGGFILLAVFLFFVFNRLKITRKQKKTIEDQKAEVELAHEVLEEKNTEIMDSITYAKRIQSAILPQDKAFHAALENAFVLYKPKDVVAGDFYWLEQSGNKTLFAAADCTGHGVPGAMVSVICNGALNRSVREFGLNTPGKILDQAREIVIREFEKSAEEVKDGMDIALCSLTGMKLEYSGANNPLWIVRNGEIIETKADKQPIGKYAHTTPYATHEFDLVSGDTLYIFSDGYVDQFGGENGKKFKTKALRSLLLEIQDLDMPAQKQHLDQAFENWRGDHEQIDDICMIGVRV